MKVGEVIDGRYRLIERLGEGGFGAVWRAADVPGGVTLPDVAIKFVKEGTPEEEISRLAHFDHPHILTFKTVCRHNGRLCLVTEFAEGGDLRGAILRAGGAMPWSAVGAVVAGVASALRYLHEEHQLIHRDIKPANILIAGDRAKLGDIGIAKDAAGTHGVVIHSGTMTPRYAAPEMLRSMLGTVAVVDYRSDVYSLALTAFEAGTGGLPFASEADHLLGRPTLPPSLSPLWRALFEGCLTGTLSSRWSVDALIAHLKDQPFADGRLPNPKPRPRPRTPPPRRARAKERPKPPPPKPKPKPKPKPLYLEPRRLHTIDAHRCAIGALAFGPDGETLVAGSAEGQVSLWSTERGRNTGRLEHDYHLESIEALRFSPDGRWLAAAGEGGVAVWGWPSRRLRHTLVTEAPVVALDFVAGGDLLIGLTHAYEGGYTLDLAAGDEGQRLYDIERCLAPHPTDREVVSITATGDVVRVELDSGRASPLSALPDGPGALAYAPAPHSKLAAAYYGAVRVVGSASATLSAPLRDVDVLDLAWEATGRVLAVAGSGPSVGLWHLEADAGSFKWIERGDAPGEIVKMSYAGDGKLLAAGFEDGRLKVWRLEAQASLRPR